MNTEVRFLLAIALMLAVLVGTNFVFPPVVPEEVLVTDSTTARSNLEGDVGGTSGTASVGEPVSAAISLPGMPGAAADEVLLPSDTEAGVTTGGLPSSVSWSRDRFTGSSFRTSAVVFGRPR